MIGGIYRVAPSFIHRFKTQKRENGGLERTEVE